MIGTGKYDFPGIRRAGALGLRALVAGTTWGAAIIAGPFRGVFNVLAEWVSEWLTNRGLLLINVGAIYVNGEFDQGRFDAAFDEGIQKAKAPGLTDAQKKVIDDEVINAFRRFGRIQPPDPR